MPKYIYKPIVEKIKEVYLENAEQAYDPGFDIESTVRLTIEANSEAEADMARVGFVDIRMWELVQD